MADATGSDPDIVATRAIPNNDSGLDSPAATASAAPPGELCFQEESLIFFTFNPCFGTIVFVFLSDVRNRLSPATP
jgi:hypothetical protein